MPLKGDAKKVMRSMKDSYKGRSDKEIESIFYATANKQNRTPETWKKKDSKKKEAALRQKLADAVGRLTPKQELALGAKEELEHTADKGEARQIAKDHLDEDSNYYEKLRNAGLTNAKVARLKAKLASKRGLWDNIHAKRKRGGRPNPPGHPDRPTDKALRDSQTKEASTHRRITEFYTKKDSDGKSRIDRLWERRDPDGIERRKLGIKIARVVKTGANWRRFFGQTGRRAAGWSMPLAAGAGSGYLGYLRAGGRPEVQQARQVIDPMDSVGQPEDYAVDLTQELKNEADAQGVGYEDYAQQLQQQRYDQAVAAAREQGPRYRGSWSERMGLSDIGTYGLLGMGLGSSGFRRMMMGGNPRVARLQMEDLAGGGQRGRGQTLWRPEGDALVFGEGNHSVRVRLDPQGRPVPEDVTAAARQLREQASHEALFRGVGLGVGGKAALLGLSELAHLTRSLGSAGGHVEATAARLPEVIGPLARASRGVEQQFAVPEGQDVITSSDVMRSLSSLGDVGGQVQEGMQSLGGSIERAGSTVGRNVQSALTNPYVLGPVGAVGLGGLLAYLLHRRNENQRRRQLLQALAGRRG